MTRQLTRRELLFERMKDFCDDETGASAIEYGLLGGLVALVLAVPLKTIGTELFWTIHCVRFKIMGWSHEACS